MKPVAPPEELLRTLDLVVRKRISGLVPGEHRSAGTGDGSELHSIRAYVPGDDARDIDWNVSARTGQPHVRVHVAERVLTTWILLDVSASMAFGTADRRKSDVAAGVALALGHIGSRRGNRVGLVSYGDGEPQVRPPRRGRPGLLSVMLSLGDDGDRDASGPTSLGRAIGLTGLVSRRGAFVAIVGDLRGPRDWAEELARLAARHEVLVVEVRDPREQELPPVGHLWLVDPETGRQLQVDTSSAKLRTRFAERAAAERAEVARDIARAGAGHVVLSTAGDWLQTFAGHLSREAAR